MSRTWEEQQINDIGVGTLKCDGCREQLSPPWRGALINTLQYQVKHFLRKEEHCEMYNRKNPLSEEPAFVK